MAEEMNMTAAQEPNPEASFEARLKAASEIAEKHDSVLSEEEKVEYALALSGGGFEQEIALLKAKMKCMMLLYPYNMAMLARILSERLKTTRRALFNKDGAVWTQHSKDLAGLGLYTDVIDCFETAM